MSEVKPVENTNKNLQSLLEVSPVQKEVLPSHKLQEHAYEYQIPFGLKEDELSQRNCQNQLRPKRLSHTEQEHLENMIYNSRDIVCNRLKLVIMSHFLLFFGDFFADFVIWTCHHFTNGYQKSQSNNVCFLRYGV